VWSGFSLTRSGASSDAMRGGRTTVTVQAASAGANAFVAGSAVFKGGTKEAYKANISAICNAAALARGEAIQIIASPADR
jgi:hypothetical protein